MMIPPSYMEASELSRPQETQAAAMHCRQGQLGLQYLGLKMVFPQSTQGWWVILSILSTSTPSSSEVLQCYTTTVLQSLFTK